jgi:S1-C subfamily serine protease
MKKLALYSRSARARSASEPPRHRTSGDPAGADPAHKDPGTPVAGRPRAPWLRFGKPHERLALVAAGALFAVLLTIAHAWMAPSPRELTQRDIDAAVLHTLETVPLPSLAAKAYEAIRPSVVSVHAVRLEAGKTVDAVGTGVVIVESGIILTNLHVVAGADKVTVQFFDGLESDANVTGMRPEHDLAVLQAKTLPDDLVPATLRSTADLAVGDEVVAVGFPFGIGPSASAGVVSGLRREYQSPEGKRLLTNLIQFDAAVNPGNSGGPLVTRDGEVVGIVTGILNPSTQRVFIGIGFAVPIENAAAAIGIPPF